MRRLYNNVELPTPTSIQTFDNYSSRELLLTIQNEQFNSFTTTTADNVNNNSNCSSSSFNTSCQIDERFVFLVLFK